MRGGGAPSSGALQKQPLSQHPGQQATEPGLSDSVEESQRLPPYLDAHLAGALGLGLQPSRAPRVRRLIGPKDLQRPAAIEYHPTLWW
jgi:hypothetical protein